MNRNIDISQKEFEAIEQYLHQSLSEEEKNVFNKRLVTDLSFRYKFETARLLFLSIQEAELEKKLDIFHTDIILKNKNGIQAPTKYVAIKKWMAAASVVFVMGLISLYFLNQKSKEEELFINYYKQDTGLISTMAATDNYLFDRAMVDYKLGEYDAALHSWKGLLEYKPANDTLNYFIASAYMGKGNNEKAISYFRKVIINQDSFFKNDALWYTGLALLKKKKIKEAISFLEKAEHQDKDELLAKLKEKE